MATRRQIREAFYSELETAATPHISADRITQESPNSAEELPTIVHNDAYREDIYHTGSGPTNVTTDANGNVDSITYKKMMEAVFGLLIQDPDEQAKETLYEAVRSHFERYETPLVDESTIQSDIHDISVTSSISEDQDDREPRVRGDRLQIMVGYKRDRVTLTRGTDFESIADVEHLIDADNDGTVDETYNTT
jgi:hypothetical protein